MRWILLTALVVFVTANLAVAQDIIVRPDALAATLNAKSAAQGRVPSELCLIVNGTDHLNPVNHLSCVPIAGLDAIAATTVTNPLGSGDIEYRAIVTVVSPTVGLVISEPSANRATVLDLPLPPDLF